MRRRQRSVWQKIGFQQGDNESPGFSRLETGVTNREREKKPIQARSQNSAVQNHRGNTAKTLQVLDSVQEAPGLKIIRTLARATSAHSLGGQDTKPWKDTSGPGCLSPALLMQLHGVLATRLCFCPGRGEGGALEALMPHLASSDVPRSPGTPLVPPGSGRACVRKHPGLYTCARQGGKQDRVGARGQPRSPAVQMKASADPTWSSGVTMVHGSGLSGGRGLASYPRAALPKGWLLLARPGCGTSLSAAGGLVVIEIPGAGDSVAHPHPSKTHSHREALQ